MDSGCCNPSGSQTPNAIIVSAAVFTIGLWTSLRSTSVETNGLLKDIEGDLSDGEMSWSLGGFDSVSLTEGQREEVEKAVEE